MNYPRGRKVTIVDVARMARVSSGTVSNALSGKRPVAEETRRRILEAIDTLGYQPNLVARGLVNRRTATLGVVAAGLEFYGPSRTLVGIEERANQLGYSLLLNLLHRPDERNVQPVLHDLAARRVDGIIWAVHEVGENRAWLQEEILRDLPPIVFLTMEPRGGILGVNTDNRAAAALATRHLLEQGRSTVGLIAGPQNWWEARERKQGWADALREAGKSPQEMPQVEGDWSPESGRQALLRLLEESPQVEAVFISNDHMALGALATARQLGRRVPDDLAIVGFDNMPESAFFGPPLTTVRQRLRDLGRKAVEVLEQEIQAREGEEEPPVRMTHWLAPELVVRESSGARVVDGEGGS
jgi:LacI family transcriptional regulator